MRTPPANAAPFRTYEDGTPIPTVTPWDMKIILEPTAVADEKRRLAARYVVRHADDFDELLPILGLTPEEAR